MYWQMISGRVYREVNEVDSSYCSWLLGRRPEYTDPKVVAQGEGREGTSLTCRPIMCVCAWSSCGGQLREHTAVNQQCCSVGRTWKP